jgi:GT2 family glycosyltransferase
MAKDITLIITNWNGSALLRECLPTIRKAVEFDARHSYEVLVIDDCSADDSLEVLAREFPWVRREKPPKNLGFQEANNYAIRLADSPIVVPMNNDIKLHRESLFHLAKHFDPIDGPPSSLFAVSGRFYGFDQTTFLYGNRGGFFRKGHFHLYEKPMDDRTTQTLFACGAAFMVYREKYLALGGFDNLYHPLYYEEIDLSYRALKRGWEVRYEPESIAYHKVQSTITKQEKQRQIGLISARNNYLFVWKNILDKGLTLEFLLFIPLFLLRDLLRFKSRFWVAFSMALRRLPQALEGRRKEKSAARFTDGEILARINGGSHARRAPA